MKLSENQKKELDNAISSIEYGEITIKANGEQSFIDITESRKKRIYREEEQKNDNFDKSYKKG